MADLSINTSQRAAVNEDMGQNLVFNGDFESAPSFTAATNTNNRFIDGTAAGSTTTDTWRWFLQKAGTVAAQFDSTNSHGGSNSMKVSTLATSSNALVQDGSITSAANIFIYAIPVAPSTAYSLIFWMKTNVTSGSATTGAKIVCLDYNSAGTNIASTGSTGIKTTTNWTQYTLTVNTNASAAYEIIQLTVTGNDGTGTLIMDAWFDDIQFQKTTPTGQVMADLNPVITPGTQNISGPKIWS